MPCFVPGCDAGKKNSTEFHLYRPPKKVVNKWCEILNKLWKNKKFNPNNVNHRVCIRHFEEDCVLKTFSVVVKGKTDIHQRGRWTLKNDSIPTIFPTLSKSLIPNVPKPRRPLIRCENVPPAKRRRLSVKKVAVDLDVEPPTDNQKYVTKEICLPLEVIQEPVMEASAKALKVSPLDALVHWIKLDQATGSEWILKKSDPHLVTAVKLIFTRERLPAISKSVTVSRQGGMNMTTFGIFGEDVTSKILNGTSLTNANFSDFMNQFANLNGCKGLEGFSPDLVGKTGVWKGHRLFSSKCAGLGKAVVCENCKRLNEILMQRLSKLKLPTHTSSSNTILKGIRAKTRYYKGRVKRLTEEKQRLKKELTELKLSLKDIDAVKLQDKIEALSIPTTTKESILHAVKMAKIKSARGMRYSTAFLLECLLLKIKSSAAYRHIRNCKLLPLPHPDTISKLIASQKCEFGFNESSMEAIRRKFDGKGRRDRQGVIMFDEIHLRETLDFSTQKHKLDGFIDYAEYTEELLQKKDEGKLANHALVIMYRPFNDNWVQPIAAFATRNAASSNVLHKVVLEAIVRLEQIGAEVTALVCDGAQTNKSFMRKCGIGLLKAENKMTHPCDDRRNLFFCSDTPHLFKCIRNNMMKKGIVNYNGVDADFWDYRKLLAEDKKRSAGLRKCPKLTQSHVQPNNFQKMTVPLATQLFSRSVAMGLKFYRTLGVEELQGTEGTEEFTNDMNALFDLLNVKNPSEGISVGSEKYQQLKRFQDKLAIEWKNFTEAPNRLAYILMASKETFLGLRITIASTIELIDYLCTSLGYGYVLTGKINQDCLEKFFGLVRFAGGCEDHPTVTNFAQLFRLLSLYNPVKQILKGNCRGEEDLYVLESFVTDLRKKSKLHKLEEKERKADLDNLIIEKLANLEGETAIYENDDDLASRLDKCIIYYLTGFLCFKASKLLQCKDCISSLNANDLERQEHSCFLTEIVDYGALHYPSKALFDAIISVEQAFCYSVKSLATCGDIIMTTMQNVSFNDKMLLGCNAINHSEKVACALFPYYITMRMHFLTKFIRNDLGHGKATKNKRKESKLTK